MAQPSYPLDTKVDGSTPNLEKGSVLGTGEERERKFLETCIDDELPTEEEKREDRRVVRRIDFYLVPWLSFLYLLSFLDRTNIGNAKIAGMNTDLNLTSETYNIALTVFFISYALAEPFCNVLLKAMRPSLFIPIIMVVWGVVMTLMGLCQNHEGLQAARFFLGLAEAGLFPGINYYLSCWYKRREFGLRAAIFFSAAALSGSFGGLLAAAISNLNGVAGLSSWRWIFILEGIATVIAGVMSFWLVFDFPDTANFLGPVDQARVIKRLAADEQHSSRSESFNSLYLKAALTDWKTYMGMVVYMGCDMSLYAFALVLPTIIATFKLSTVQTQLYTVAPYACACVCTVAVGYGADRFGHRGLFNMAFACVAIVGYIMLISTSTQGVQYAGAFLAASGIYPCIANTISWVANNHEGVYKRGIVLGLVIGWGNLNGVVSSNIYRDQDKPRYFVGHAVVLGYLVVFLLGGSAVMYYMLDRENKRRDNLMRADPTLGRVDSLSSDSAMWALGDKAPTFRYKL